MLHSTQHIIIGSGVVRLVKVGIIAVTGSVFLLS